MSVFRFFAPLFVLFLLNVAHAAPAPLVLDDAVPRVEAWPAVTLVRDPGGRLDVAELVAAPGRFAVPQSAYATLGMEKGVVWVRVPVQLP